MRRSGGAISRQAAAFIAGGLIMKLVKQSLSLLLSGCLLFVTTPGVLVAQADQSAPQPPVQTAPQTPEQLQQLVAPIALYPDALVAQILAAATYPDQIVEADRWLQQHTDLKDEQLGKEVDKQPWDPSVKALVEFPSVLANMDKNLSWTSSLGDAYVNQQQDVMNAVQAMRDRAEKAGNLKSTSQEKVSKQGQTIVIEPADPEVVYVPEYDPWLVYGEPIGIWRGWYWYPGLFFDVPELRLVSALESASLAGLAGAGDTGDTTGIITGSLSTTAPTSPTAEFSSIAIISIAPVDFMVVALRGAEASPHRATASRPAPTQAHSAASIMEESQEASLPAGSRASVEAFMVEVSEAEVFTEGEAVAGNSVRLLQMTLMIWRKNSCTQTI